MKRSSRLTKEQVRYLARLANLEVTDREVKKYQRQLGETLRYVGNLEELDTSGISEYSTEMVKSVVFEDGEKNLRGLTPNQSFSNTNNRIGQFFAIKRILRKKKKS